MSHPVRHPRLAAVLGAALILAACGSSEPPDPPDISLGMSLVTVDRPLLLPGDTAQVMVEVRDAAGEPRGGGDTLPNTFAERRSMGRGHRRRNCLGFARA
jgi:hypothetical protein